MVDFTPKSNKAELHLMYDCTLACANCNRLSVLRNPHTPAMTLDDAREFFRQCRELNWSPGIILIGGEPTMHPDFMEFVRLSREFAGPTGFVQVWSNGYTPEARELCARARHEYGADVPAGTHKFSGSVVQPDDDIFVSPVDFGKPTHSPCMIHSSTRCGISVDAGGYSVCAMGGMVDGFLELGIRTKNLSDLFDPEKAAEMTKKMCEHCGLSGRNNPQATQAEWRAYVEKQPKKYGSYMSPTWLRASVGKR